MTTELFDVLDENGNKTAIQKNKKEIHEKGLWHQAVHIWLFNSNGEILLQKRAKNKDYWPGLWDISVAGHVSAGEVPEQAVIREIEEEIGIKVSLSQLKKIEIRKSEKHINDINYHNREFDYVFLFRFDGDISKLKFEDKEIENIKFISINKLEKELADKKEKDIWKKIYKQIITVRRKSNVTYGVLNGDKKATNFFNIGKFRLENVKFIILFTDGLLIPKENPEDEEDWNKFISIYNKSGLKGLLNYVRSIENTDPNCLLYPRFKRHDDIAAIAIRLE